MKNFGVGGCLAVALIFCSETALAATQAATQPLVASASDDIPEPTDLTLFLIGIAGLVIGLRSGRTRLRQNEEQ